MAIDYTSANVAADDLGRSNHWFREHAYNTCAQCKHYEPCECGCGWGWCHERGYFTCSEYTVKEYDLECWEEK